MMWKDLTQRLTEAKNTALETAQQYQNRFNTTSALSTAATDKLKATLRSNKPPPPPPPTNRTTHRLLIDLKEPDTEGVPLDTKASNSSLSLERLPTRQQQNLSLLSSDEQTPPQTSHNSCSLFSASDRNISGLDEPPEQLSVVPPPLAFHSGRSPFNDVDNQSLFLASTDQAVDLTSAALESANSTRITPDTFGNFYTQPQTSDVNAFFSSLTNQQIGDRIREVPRDFLEQVAESLIFQLAEVRAQLNVSRTECKAARDTAFSAAGKFEQLQDKLAKKEIEHQRDVQRSRETAVALNTLQQRHRAAETKLQHLSRTNDELQQVRVELHSQLQQVLEDNEALRMERETLELTFKQLKIELKTVEEQYKSATEKSKVSHEKFIGTEPGFETSVPTQDVPVSLYAQNASLTSFQHDIIKVAELMRNVTTKCDLVLNHCNETSPDVLFSSALAQPLRDSCLALCQPLSEIHDSLSVYISAFIKLVAAYSKCFSGLSVLNSSNHIASLDKERPQPLWTDALDFCTNHDRVTSSPLIIILDCITEGLTCITNTLTSSDAFYWLANNDCDVADCPPALDDTINPSTGLPSNSLGCQGVSSELAISAFTELLTVLHFQTLELQRSASPGELERIVGHVHFVLDTIEERIPCTSGRLALSSAARQLFSTLIHLTQNKDHQDMIMRLQDETKQLQSDLKDTTEHATESKRLFASQLDEMSLRCSRLEEELASVKTKERLPPSQEELDVSHLTGSVVLLVRIADSEKDTLWCCILLTSSSSSPKFQFENACSTETQRAWHPGVSWWPLSVLERDSHWSKAVKAVPILPDYYYAELSALQQQMEERERVIRRAEQQMQQLTAEFKEYKRKAADALEQRSCDASVQKDSVCFGTAFEANPTPTPHVSNEEPTIERGTNTILYQQYQQEIQQLQRQLGDKTTQWLELKSRVQQLQQQLLYEQQQQTQQISDVRTQLSTALDELQRYKDLASHLQSRTEQLVTHLVMRFTSPKPRRFKRGKCLKTSDLKLAGDVLRERTAHNTTRLDSLAAYPTQRTSTATDVEEQYTRPPLSPTFERKIDLQSNEDEDPLSSLHTVSPAPFRVSEETPSIMHSRSPLTTVHTLRRALRACQRQLEDERYAHAQLKEQVDCLKAELRKAETVSRMQPFTGSRNAEGDAVPMAFVRHTLLRFLATGCPGDSEHEALIPVIASVFSFSREEIKKIQDERQQRRLNVHTRFAPFSLR